MAWRAASASVRGLPPAGAALVSLLADGQYGRRPNFTATRGARLPVFSIVNSGTRLRKALSFIQCADHQCGIGLVVRRIRHDLWIESFTPLLNPPQVAILGVNAIQLKAVRRDGRVEFIDSIGFSLTCDHQAIDGAPGAPLFADIAATTGASVGQVVQE